MRSLEQELLHALVNCLTADDIDGHPTRRHHDIMIRFEETLSEHTGRQPSMPELCAAIGVPERTLRICCAEFLGKKFNSVSSTAALEPGALCIAERRSSTH